MQKIFFALFIFINLYSHAQFHFLPFPPSAKDYKLTEKLGIKTCKVYQKTKNGKTLVNIMEFGAKGLPVILYERGTDLNGDSITITETTYKYNDILKLASETNIDKEYNDESIITYFYNTNGRLIKKIIATFDPVTYIYSYDVAGRISKVTSTIKMPALDKEGDPTGKTFDKPSSKSIFKYDTKNRLIEEWYYYTDMGPVDESQPIYKTKFGYDDKNQLISISSYDVDEDLTHSQELLYNEKGLLIIRNVTFAVSKDHYVFTYEYCTDCKQSWMQ